MSEIGFGLTQARDDEAFRELVEPFWHELHVHCYRMLGSLSDADDVLQETMLAAWRGLDGFEGRAGIRTWLYRIATNRCLNALRDGRRRPPEPKPPFTPPEPTHAHDATWLQPYPDAMLDQLVDQTPGPEARYTGKEAVELAFITGLQLLRPRQAAVLILRDVLGFSMAEVAAMLDTTETAVKGALQRARSSLDRRRAVSGDRPARSAGPDDEGELAKRFADAFTSGDVDGVIELLTDDAWLTMPPAPHRYRGHSAIRGFLDASFTWRADRTMIALPQRANRQEALAFYLTEPGGVVGFPAGLVVLTIGEHGICEATRFLDDAVFSYFGLSVATTVP